MPGERRPSRAWKLTRRADGTWDRVQLDPAKIHSRDKVQFEKKQIAAARARLGFSQTQFAALLGVSVDTLQNWEQGRCVPNGAARVLLRIAASNPKAVLAAA